MVQVKEWMELPTFLLLIAIAMIVFYLIFYALLSGLQTEKNYFRVIISGLIALVAGLIIASILLPNVTYDYCAPLSLNIPKFSIPLGGFSTSIGPLGVPIISCNTIKDTIVKVAAVLIITLIALLVAESLANLI